MTETGTGAAKVPRINLREVTAAVGMIPIIVLLCVIFFGVLEPRFLSEANLFNLTRQASYLIIICMAQFLILLTGGLDLSVGSTVALVSVVTATLMKSLLGADAVDVGMAVTLSVLAGIGTGLAVGLFNGIGVAVFKVTPFVMTLGSFSMALGLALFISGGYSIAGLPTAFGDVFAYATMAGIPVPILYAALIALAVYLLLNWSWVGRYFYALGSNLKAAHLSGVRTTLYLILAYVVSGGIVGLAGILMTARTESGEANLGGAELVLKAIAGCVIGGVALSGGKGLLRNVILGAFFITALSNGMNLLRVNSYLQTFILGAVLIAAIALDQLRVRMTASR